MSKVTLNIDTDLDELIKKCDELNKQLEELEDKGKRLHFINVRELAEMLHCSLSTARAIFRLPDFPEIDFCKEKVVLLDALKEWCMTKRSKKDYK